MAFKTLYLHTAWSVMIFCLFWQNDLQAKNNEYISHQQLKGDLIIKTTTGFIEIENWNNSTLRVTASVDTIFQPPSDAIFSTRSFSEFLINDHDSVLIVKSDELVLKINKSPFSIAFESLEGSTYTSEISGGYRESGNYGLRFSLTEAEKITGGGARAIPLNRRGYALKLNNEPHYGYGFGEENLNYSLPVFISSKKYLLFFDAPQRAMADIGKSDPDHFNLFSSIEDCSVFFSVGDNYKSLLKNYTQLTGTQPLPPRWALGQLISRFGYKSQKETLNMADTLLIEDYPLDAIILDLYWFGKGKGDYRMGNLNWEKDNWPTPNKMINELRHKGIKTILITEPFILKSSSNFSATDSLKVLGKNNDNATFIIEDFYFGPTGIIDIFSASGQDWYWNQYKSLKTQGIAGWWGDLGEPERHPSGIHYQTGTSDNLHNTYGHYWSKMLSENYAATYPKERLFFLNRAGYAGSQRYSIFPWSGDVSRSWSGLKAQCPIMLGMSINGIPYMHSDLGGFAGGHKNEELYTRWLQFGTFTPIFRPHGERIPSEPVFYSDSTQAIVKDFIKLRYRLMPYNYTMAWQQTTLGAPLARPLFYMHPAQDTLFNIMDTYYWGDNFLISPVVEKGQTHKKVFFPEGHWFDFFTNEEIKGGQTIDWKTEPSTIPVFVKAGSFIPMKNNFFTTDQYQHDSLTVNYYYHPEVKSSNYTLFEDDGKDRQSLDFGEYELVHFSSTANNKAIGINITSNGGRFPGKPKQQTMTINIINLKKTPRAIRVNGEKISKKDQQLTNNFLELSIKRGTHPLEICIEF